jgi:hypothetical protein
VQTAITFCNLEDDNSLNQKIITFACSNLAYKICANSKIACLQQLLKKTFFMQAA